MNNIIDVCEHIVKDTSNIKRILEESKSNKEVLLKEKPFSSIYSLCYLLNTISLTCDRGGDKTVNSFQDNYIEACIGTLKSKIPYDEIKYTVLNNANGYKVIKATCYLNGEDIPIFILDVFLKTIESLNYDRITDYEHKINDYMNKIDEINSEIELKNNHLNNPLALAESPLEMMNMALNKKKVTESIKEELLIMYDKKNKFSRAIDEMKDDIDYINDSLIPIYILRDRYIDRVVNYFKFSVISY